MREHLRDALLQTRAHLLKIKAGKYSDEKEEGGLGVTPKANPTSGSSGSSNQSEVSEEPKIPLEEDFEKEKVEFFRKKRKPKVREVIGIGKG